MTHQAIKQAIHAADQAINNSDFAAVADFYTDDAALVVRPGLLAYGRNDIKKAHERISRYFNGSLEVTQGEIVVIEAGNTALVLAKASVKAPAS